MSRRLRLAKDTNWNSAPRLPKMVESLCHRFSNHRSQVTSHWPRLSSILGASDFISTSPVTKYGSPSRKFAPVCFSPVANPFPTAALDRSPKLAPLHFEMVFPRFVLPFLQSRPSVDRPGQSIFDSVRRDGGTAAVDGGGGGWATRVASG